MTDSSNARSRGRPRDPETQESILRATREVLLEVGYAGLTIEGVAARAGAGKATVYRWWPTKGDLVLESAADHLDIGFVPDTGDTARDLTTAAGQLIETFTDRLAGVVILAAVASLDDDPSMAASFRENWVYPWRSSAEHAIRRGIERGDLPATTDVSLTLDLIVGIVFQRTLVMREPETDGLAEAVVDLLLPA